MALKSKIYFKNCSIIATIFFYNLKFFFIELLLLNLLFLLVITFFINFFCYFLFKYNFL